VSRNPLSGSGLDNSCCLNISFFRADAAQILLRWLRVVAGSLVGDGASLTSLEEGLERKSGQGDRTSSAHDFWDGVQKGDCRMVGPAS